MLSEDMTIYFDPAGLGDTATVWGNDVHGVFERQYVEVKQIEGYYPTFLLSDTDASAIEKNSAVITIDNVNYHAISKRPDGTGMTLLILEKE